jgi:hypothetical protein
MSRPVPETPPLPYPSGSNSYQIAAFNQDLTKALYTYLSDIARRTNESLPKDGTEAMKASLDMGGFSIINVANFTMSGTLTANAASFATLAVSGLSSLHATNVVGTLAVTGNETVSGSSTVNSLVVTTTATVAGSPVQTDATAGWVIVHESTFSAVTSKIVTGLGAYRDLEITAELQPDSTADAFAMNFGNASAVFDTTNWGQNLMYMNGASASPIGAVQAGTKAYYDMNWNNTMAVPATIDFPFMFNMSVQNFNKTVHKSFFTRFVSYLSPAATIFTGTDQGYNNARQACDRIRIRTVSNFAFSGHLLIRGRVG